MSMTIGQIKERKDDICRTLSIAMAKEINSTLLAEVEKLGNESEQLRVQLAGCGVAAMCNTRESMEQQLCKKGDYGYSASYQDVINCVGREIDLRDKLAVATDALRKITDIENRYDCGDWEEIEEARSVATAALKQIQEAGNE